MDIQVSSNFERLLFEACRRDVAQVRGAMASLAQSRRFSISSEALSAIRGHFSAGRADEDETAATIRTTLRETSHLVDPHTAVGLAVAEKEVGKTTTPMIVRNERSLLPRSVSKAILRFSRNLLVAMPRNRGRCW